MRIFVSDCEGPIAKNDNAFEVTEHFVPDGDKLFSIISKYDDILADVFEKPGYEAGSTLKLILPFLKAYGVTNETMRRFSRDTLLLMPGVKEALEFIRQIMPAFIVSTSYEQYISAMCDAIEFPVSNVYCTRLDLDRYEVGSEEIGTLQELAREISRMPLPEIPEGAKRLEEFSSRDQQTIKRLDEIFWRVLPGMASGVMLRCVKPIGGIRKAEAVRKIAERHGAEVGDIVYVGDSITDVPPFKLVGEREGLTVSFNGNVYAIREAQIAIMSENAAVLAVIADVFNKRGAAESIEVVRSGGYEALVAEASQRLKDTLKRWKFAKPQRVEAITDENRAKLARESTEFRKSVRGVAIGKLG